jgi:ankyrin repeat protein
MTKDHILSLIKNDEDRELRKFLKDISKEELNEHAWDYLEAAIEFGRFHPLYELIQAGIEINVTDMHNATPLHLALYKQEHDLAYLLIRNGADLRVYDLWDELPLHTATLACIPDLVGCILKEGNFDIDTPTLGGCTPLWIATYNKDTEMMSYLLRNGADPTVKSSNGDSPIDIANKYKDKELINLLKEYIR